MLNSAYFFFIPALINDDFAGSRATMQPICSCSNSSAWEECTGMRVLCIVARCHFCSKNLSLNLKYYLIQVILELESPNRDAVVYSIDRPDFTCGSSKSNLSQLLSHQRSLGLWIWYEGITWNEWWIPYDLFVIGIVSNSRVSCFSYSTKGKIFYGYW